ncbi:hypothetical protein EON63_24985 [archaeon]|nr:MAG: hypothetical protein EON63_24985 [archaeon]
MCMGINVIYVDLYTPLKKREGVGLGCEYERISYRLNKKERIIFLSQVKKPSKPTKYKTL